MQRILKVMDMDIFKTKIAYTFNKPIFSFNVQRTLVNV